MSLKFLTGAAIIAGLMSTTMSVRAQTTITGTQATHQLNANPSMDKTLSWKEVQPAAEARFKQLDTDHDGTLSKQEAAKAGITETEFSQANTKGTRTLSQQEYLSLAQVRFKAVNNNPGTDHTLSSRELNSAAGQSLIKLLDLKS